MPNCRQCVQTELLLEDAGILFQKVVVKDANKRALLRAQYDAATFPILVEQDKQVYVGFQGAQNLVDLSFAWTF